MTVSKVLMRWTYIFYTTIEIDMRVCVLLFVHTPSFESIMLNVSILFDRAEQIVCNIYCVRHFINESLHAIRSL